MSFRTIMGSIGNAFKSGWANGNIQKGISATGMTLFGVGMIGGMANDIKKNGSIFGGGCNHCSSGMMGSMGMLGSNPYSLLGGTDMLGSNPYSLLGGTGMLGSNPYSLLGGTDMLGSNPYSLLGGTGMLGSNPYSLLGGTGMLDSNPYNTQFGNMMAFQYGQQMATQLQLYPGSTPFLAQAPKELEPLSYSNEDAGEVESSVDTKKGTEFDDATTALAKNSDAKDVVIAADIKNGRVEDKQKYTESLKALAKSVAKDIGGTDGKITLSEYIEHERENVVSENEDITEEKLEATIKHAFIQMDLNGDGEIDWKEMASSIATYDASGESTGSFDGKISKSNYEATLKAIVAGTFGKANWANYKNIFGNPDSQ